MLPGARTSDGALVITTVAPQPGDFFNSGIAMTPEGAVRVTDGAAPQVFNNGLGMMTIGALCVDPGGTIAGYQAGLPATVDGRLVVQLNQPVSPGDSFVGGIRVGPLGGVYVTDVAPPPFKGFSDGFDGGFG